MKKWFNNLWIQLILGLFIGVSTTTTFAPLAIVFFIKYSGFNFFDLSASGDNSPITLTLAIIFLIIALTFPTLIWFFINKFGKLKFSTKRVKACTFLLFLFLPFWITLSLRSYSKLQNLYEKQQSVRKNCVIENGTNTINTETGSTKVECKNGIYDGLLKRYNKDGTLIYEANYSKGEKNGSEKVFFDSGKLNIISEYKNDKKEGVEIFYNENGSTSLYVINSPEKSVQIYFQIPEKNISSELDVKSQNYLCKNLEKYNSENYSFKCSNNLLTGNFTKYDTSNNPVLKAYLTNGVLDGAYENYSDGNLKSHLEFSDGKLNGSIYKLSTTGGVEYEGQYVNGLQVGTFKMYDYRGNIISQVTFDNGEITDIIIPDTAI